MTFIETEGFPVPIEYNETDLFLGNQRLFTMHFTELLNIMTIHGLLGHSTSFCEKELMGFFDSCDNGAKNVSSNYRVITELKRACPPTR